MILQNRTGVDDSVLYEMLLSSAKGTGARTSKVYIQVNTGNWVKGRAFNCVAVRWGGAQRHECEGAVRLTLSKWGDCLTTAETAFRVMQHEWGHIADYQSGARYHRTGKRQLPHDLRPQEIVANEIRERAQGEGHTANRYSEVILGLAVELERVYKGKA